MKLLAPSGSVIQSRAMKIPTADRSLIAWVLYCSVLLAVFASSLGHGQMAGLQLNGAGGLFCALHGQPAPALDSNFSDPLPGDAAALFCCLSCSTFALAAVVLLFGLALWLPPQRHWLRSLAQRGKASPRYTWPSANPRASP